MVMLNALDKAIARTQDYLIRIQNKDGYWVGQLESDASVTAGYIPFMYFMGVEVDSLKRSKLLHYILGKQGQDGSWSSYCGGPGELNVTVQVYFALKLAGLQASEPSLQKARDFIVSHGGLMKTNTITRIWLALFGQLDYKYTPSIPAEIVLLPNWFYINIYEFASWSRETIMALILILNTKPVCKVPSYADVSELNPKEEVRNGPMTIDGKRPFTWRNFFLGADRVFKATEKAPFRPTFKGALKKVETWVVEHQEADGSWGGILLPWLYSLMALKSLGYSSDQPVIKKGLEGLDSFLIEDSSEAVLQPATSPVWDTAWASLALIESGLPPDDPSLARSGRWLLQAEVRKDGDWKIKNPGTPAGCWAFEFTNQFYPDMDDTAVAARALLSLMVNDQEEPAKREAVSRGLRWIEDMQSRDGGWAAFDRDNNKQILASVPYADFMTPLDPTSPDVTAHALDLMGGMAIKPPALERGIKYLQAEQLADGSWYGRWGVNYIYGTALALASLKAAGQSMEKGYVQRAVDWLLSHQQPDGGWGETCETYRDLSLKGKGASTASQTAWSLIGLIACGMSNSRGVRAGIQYLLEQQKLDGTWVETAFTGTGFPGAFYLRYDLYRIYFPLLALGHYRAQLEDKSERPA
jgi:squalene-hopene/tetraprenyl-beta-curcumene cyclase